MARHKEFEPTQALEKAMWLFWQKGYNATSIGDLVEATGVQRYGLYSTFGDKHALFLQALDHYLEAWVGLMVKELEDEQADWSTVYSFFHQFQQMEQFEDLKIGCLMCNSATELALHDTAVATKMDLYETRLKTLFEKAIRNAQSQGQLGLHVAPEKGGVYLVGIAVGLFTLSKTPMLTEGLVDYINTTLEGLHALSLSKDNQSPIAG
ncbi:MAG: TetR/AcrR family transcriptional regulator [Chloroflexota bacterium]